MLSFTRALVANVCLKSKPVCNSSFKEIRLSYAQYFILNNHNKFLIKDFKCHKVAQRDISMLSSLKLGCMNVTTQLKDLFRYGFDFIPVIGSPKLKEIGFSWYRSLDEVNIEEFFTLLNMPDTFYSRFKVIELHVWILLLVLPSESRKHNYIRYCIMIAMWEENHKRAQMVQVINKNFGKNMKDLSGKFRMSLFLYDQGYLESDVSLANAVWYNFFDKENIDPRYLEALVRFIRHQVHHLNSLNVEEVGKDWKKDGVWLSVKPHVNEIFKKG